ncbi:MAG: acyl-CoA dehydrogenase family protein [Pseudomonadales bacterium]
MKEFIQSAPSIANTYLSDHLLKAYLKRVLPDEHFREIEQDLTAFGQRAAGELLDLAEDAEANPPFLKKFDAWGSQLDEVVTSHGWKALEKVSAEEGLVAIGYERKYGEFSRLYQFAKLYLFHPSSAYFTCPLAMTDGAAKLIESFGDDELKQNAFARLTSRDPDNFWTSGQWMTERSGGSDVGGSETVARLHGNQWHLYGTKWFTSAITSQMAMTLGRIEDENGNSIDGSRGLSLFYVELKDDQGHPNNFEILRLKDKLGTRALPTAEVKLQSVPAVLVGNEGEGVKTIATLFNITRIYNACTTMGAWRRLLDLATDYAKQRVAFKKHLKDHPLHYRTLSDIEIEFQACFHLVMYVARLLGKVECGQAESADSALLRLLTPIAKSYCAKKNLNATTELIESFGGAGYLEDTGIPRWLRDNQVLTIWEGTTNVLSLDVLRAIRKDNAMPGYMDDVRTRLDLLPDSESKSHVMNALDQAQAYVERFPELSGDDLEYGARELAFSLGNIMCASLLLEHAAALPADESAQFVARQFCGRSLFDVRIDTAGDRRARQVLLFNDGS